MASQSFGYSAFDVATWFINTTDREAGDIVTHLKVQKMLYYAQGWALALLEKPLFDEDMQAWAHGPAVPSVWDKLKAFGWAEIPPQKVKRKICGDAALVLNAVNERYGIYTAKALEKRTHAETPWVRARGTLPPEARCTDIIPKEEMRAFFSGLITDAAAKI